MAPAEFVQVVQASVGRHVHQLPFLWQTTSGSKCLVKLHTLWSESEWAGVTRVIWTKKKTATAYIPFAPGISVYSS